jgi:uncharacterized protein (DUF488 family)
MNEAKRPTVFTIGHSTHTLEEFVRLLKGQGITAVADVRSHPFSRYNPQFNRENLATALKQAGIAYVFVGRELGARSDDPACYEQGRVSYERLARTDLFKSGIERILKGAEEHQIALMCAEKEPLDCHRTILVSRALVRSGAAVRHVLADGRTEEHRDSMIRLLDLVGLPHEDMFRSQEELMDEACRLREQKIAYIDNASS